MPPRELNRNSVVRRLGEVAAGALSIEDAAALEGASEQELLEFLDDERMRAAVDAYAANARQDGRVSESIAASLVDRILEKLRDTVQHEELSPGALIRIGEFGKAMAGDRERRLRYNRHQAECEQHAQLLQHLYTTVIADGEQRRNALPLGDSKLLLPSVATDPEEPGSPQC